MSAHNVSGPGCKAKAHSGLAKQMEIYDGLPRKVRDKLKIARSNLCTGCVRNSLKRLGLEAELVSLDIERRFRREKRGRKLWLVPEPELKP